MSYVTTRRIIDLSTGFTRGPGQEIFPSELEPDRWNPLIAEGAIIDTSVSPAVDATPGAEKLAQELGIDLALVQGTGNGGRVTVPDVRKYNQDELLDAENARYEALQDSYADEEE